MVGKDLEEEGLRNRIEGLCNVDLEEDGRLLLAVQGMDGLLDKHEVI